MLRTDQTTHRQPLSASLGEKDKAFELLDGAYNARSYLLVEYLNTDPRLDSLKDDPRFSTLRTRVGLPTPRRLSPDKPRNGVTEMVRRLISNREIL